MEYKAILTVSEWANGSGWDYENDEAKSWDISEGALDSWKQLFKDRDRSLFDYVIDGLNDLDDDYEEDPDDAEGDTKWTMKLVEIDDEGDEKILASVSYWESELIGKEEE